MEIATMHDMSNTRKEIAARLGFAAMGPAPLKGSPARKEENAQGKESAAERKKAKLIKDNAVKIKDIERDYNSAMSQLKKMFALLPKKFAEIKARAAKGEIDAEDYEYDLNEVGRAIEQYNGFLEDIRFARPGAKDVFAADKRTTAGALRKALKAKGITSAADLEWHGISAKDPDSTPYWLYEDGSMEKIKASRPGAKVSFDTYTDMVNELRRFTADSANVQYDWYTAANTWLGRKRTSGNKEIAVEANRAYDAVEREMRPKWRQSRPGAKTRMTREQTEEQKAGLKIMSAADPAIGAKIATLIKEGKPQDQAVAIALDMKRRGEL